MDLGSILSGIGGGIFGAIGALGSKILDYKMLGVKNAHELALRDKDREMMQLEFANKSELAKVEADTQIALKDFEAQSASLAADRATYGDSLTGRIVDTARGLIRPVITAASMILVGYDTVLALQGSTLSAQDRMSILNTSLFIAGTAITWWFGSRPNRKG